MTRLWWKSAFIRALKTFAQVAAAGLGLGEMGVDLVGINWQGILSLSAGAAVLSMLNSIAGLPEVDQKEVMQAIRGERTDPSGL